MQQIYQNARSVADDAALFRRYVFYFVSQLAAVAAATALLFSDPITAPVALADTHSQNTPTDNTTSDTQDKNAASSVRGWLTG